VIQVGTIGRIAENDLSLEHSFLGCELIAAAIKGMFFNDRANELIADSIRKAIGKLIVIVRFVGSHRAYGGTLMAENKVYILGRPDDLCLAKTFPRNTKRAVASNPRNRLNLLLSVLCTLILMLFARVATSREGKGAEADINFFNELKPG